MQDRPRRDSPDQHTLDNFFKSHFSRLDDAQKSELKKGGIPAVYAKVMEFFDQSSGDKREEASEKLKDGCSHFFDHDFGEEKMNELKKMKESGANKEEIAKKAAEFVDALPDGEHKERAIKTYTACKKIYGVKDRRRRRRRHEHTVEEALSSYLTWMTDEQKILIEEMDDAGANDDKIYSKVLEFYASTTGEKKERATEGLKAACRHYIKHAVGEYHAQDLKQLYEKGERASDISNKLDKIISGMSDALERAKAESISRNCRIVYGVSARMKRDHHGDHSHSLDHYFSTFLSWLTEEQKTEVKELIEKEGNQVCMYGKVFEYFEKTEGEKKAAAAEKMKGGCKYYFKTLFGDEKYEELKKMKETGGTVIDLSEKAEDFIEELDYEGKKQKATKVLEFCKKVFQTVD